MIMRSTIVCLLFLLALSVGVVEQGAANGGNLINTRAARELPCYVVISDELRADDQKREVTILVDKNDINEEAFVNLQRHFSAMYSDVKHLSVNVETSLNFTIGQH